MNATATTEIVTVAAPAPAHVAQAHTDEQLIKVWLHGKPESTQRAYRADIAALRQVVDKPLQALTLSDVQDFIDSLAAMSPATQRRRIATVKSLLAFGHKLGYIAFNVGAVVRLPTPKNTLAERILTEAEVHRIMALTTDERDALLLAVLYASAGRVSEVAALRWADIKPNRANGQVTLFGKGGKTRAVVLSAALYERLCAARQGAPDAGPVFASQKGGALTPSAVWRIVRSAAKRAGIAGNVSPHWFRHSHASHALERGAPVTLVRDTLGHHSLATTSMYAHARPDSSSALYLTV